MPAAGVGGDFQHRVVAVGAQHRAGGEVDVALFADGVHGAVTLGAVVGIEEQGVGGLVAFQIQNPDRLAFFHHFQKVVAGGDGLPEGGVFGFQNAFFDHLVLLTAQASSR